jgi:hypothetical protein
VFPVTNWVGCDCMEVTLSPSFGDYSFGSLRRFSVRGIVRDYLPKGKPGLALATGFQSRAPLPGCKITPDRPARRRLTKEGARNTYSSC